jgi:DNA-directed RNA polymerase specialized sigma subunit
VPFSDTDEAASVRRYMPLVKRLAMHAKGRLPETVQLDDLVQAGLIAVLRLLRSGAADAGSEAVLRRAVINAMIDEARDLGAGQDRAAGAGRGCRDAGGKAANRARRRRR